MNCRDLPEVITYLKSRTAYARALEGADPTRVRRAELEVRLRQNLFDQYAALCRYEMNIGHDFYRYFILKAEVRALANRLQELAAPGSETLRLYQMPEFIRRHSKLDAAALAARRDLAGLTAVVEGTVYHPILLSFCEKAGFVLDKDGVFAGAGRAGSIDLQHHGGAGGEKAARAAKKIWTTCCVARATLPPSSTCIGSNR